MPKGYGYNQAPKKASGFKMNGYTYPGESPVKNIGLLAKGAKLVRKAYNAVTKGSKATKKNQMYIKHDPDSGHLRFKTNYTSKGGKYTGHYIPVKGSATGKPGGLKFDPLRRHSLPKNIDFGDVDKIVKSYTGK